MEAEHFTVPFGNGGKKFVKELSGFLQAYSEGCNFVANSVAGMVWF